METFFRPWESSDRSFNRPNPLNYLSSSESDSSVNSETQNERPVRNNTGQHLCEHSKNIVLNVYRNIVDSEGENAIEKTSFYTDIIIILRTVKKWKKVSKIQRFIEQKPVVVLHLRHVCTRYQERPVKSKQAYCRPTFKNYVVNCQGNQICKGVRLVYETHYKDVITTRSSNEVIHLCCPGWSQNNNRSHGCHKATCNKPCLNGGKCVKPEMCACLKGFSGQQCEIHFHTPPCHEGCKNGGICAQDGVCKCSKGFTGRYCEHDIDECKEEKPCDQICYNTHGSYSCQCREDFVLQNDGQSCRKESDGDGGSEAKDLEFELLDRRLLKLETMMDETHKNDVSKNDLDNVYKDMGSISENINSLKNKISDVENYKKDMYVFKNKLNKIEKKAEQVDELIIKYDRIKKCAFYNKICM